MYQREQDDGLGSWFSVNVLDVGFLWIAQLQCLRFRQGFLFLHMLPRLWSYNKSLMACNCIEPS